MSSHSIHVRNSDGCGCGPQLRDCCILSIAEPPKQADSQENSPVISTYEYARYKERGAQGNCKDARRSSVRILISAQLAAQYLHYLHTAILIYLHSKRLSPCGD